jgi:hypothetical protein
MAKNSSNVVLGIHHAPKKIKMAKNNIYAGIY